MKVIYTDVLVIGGGLAGLRLAIGAKRRGHDAIILSLVPPKRSHSAAAQGGMQASLANVTRGQGDNEDVHFEDTVRGSDWGADQRVVRMFVNTAPKAVRELAAWGVPWSRVSRGDREVIINGQKATLTERDEAHGLVAQRDFGGTKKWRTCYVSDGTGHAMLFAVSDRAIAESIPVHERMEAIALIHEGNRCYGAVVRDLATGELLAYVAKATAIATGGAGRLYRVTTNAVICEGIGTAIALETGKVALGNMEAVQFHPTGIFPAGILVTEGCRGDGGLLKDVDGHRFMPDYEPEKKELASRDVVSRRMETHIRKGKGAKSRFGDHLWLDITLLGRPHIEKNLREVKEICESFLGIDPAEKLIAVRPAQHYTMGGIRTDATGQSPTLRGLFAAGEAACWDMHGFNRLGGNSVAETVVAGMIVGEFIADFCDSRENDVNIPTGVIRDFVEREQAALDAIANGRGTEDPSTLKAAMQDLMTDKVGIFRTGADLAAAVSGLQSLLERSRSVGLRSRAPGPNPELVTAYRTQKMLKLALCVAYGAAQRTESRGAHFREDFPRRDDAQWLKRTLATWPGADRPAAYAGVRAARRGRDGTAAGMARLRRQGLRRPSGHPGAHGRSRRAAREAGTGRALRGPAGADALRLPAAREPARPQRTHRRAARQPHQGERRMTAPASTATVDEVVDRKLTIRILRYNPQDPASTPHLQSYELADAAGMTLFIALSELREKQDPSLQFDFVCRAGICGSCAMLVDGRPALACRTLTKNLPAEFTLAPLPVFELIGDLSVNTGKWMRGMSERLEAWVHTQETNPDLTRLEARMEPELAEKIYELDRCIECGCCVAGCGTARMREAFVGAVGLNKVARFRIDPRDTRDDEDFYELIGDDNGIFGCMSLLGCHDVCPKQLPFSTQLAFLRRKMVTIGFK